MRDWRLGVVLAGAGPGRPDLITVRGREWLSRADVILYDRLVHPKLLDVARAECRLIFVGKEDGRHTVAQQEIIRLMIVEARKGNLVVRLKGGDPCVFGRGGEEAQALARAGIPFEIVPGVTAGVGVAAYAGVPLTHRLLSSCVAFSTAHQAGHSVGETRVLYMTGKKLSSAASDLIEAGFSPKTPALLIEEGTWPQQRSQVTTLDRLKECVVLHFPVLVIVGDVVRCREGMNWFEQRPLFGKKILVPRSRAHQGKLAAFLDEAGAEPVEFTPVRFKPLGNLSSVLKELSNVRAVHFGDPQSAEFFMGELRDARRLAGYYVSAAGHFTASTLRRHGIVPDGIGGIRREPVLWIGTGEIPEGIQACRVSVYQEILHVEERNRIMNLDLHAAAFPSSNSVRRTVSLFGSPFLTKFPLFSMGLQTTREIKRHGLEATAEAAPSTFEGLVETVVGHFSERTLECRGSFIS